VAAVLLTVVAMPAEAVGKPGADKAPTDAATASVKAFFADANAEWTAPVVGNGLGVARVSGGSSRVANLRKAVEESGLTVVSADTRTDLLSLRTVSGQLTASTMVSVAFQWKDTQSGKLTAGSMSDEHVTKLTADGLTVLSDTTIDPTVGVKDDGVAVPMPGSAKASTVRVRNAGPKVKQTKQAAGFTAMAAGMEGLSYADMAAYAKKWSVSATINPAFPTLDNNCANFVSQVLHAGGWNYRGGYVPATLTNWTPNLTGPAGSSYTWGAAKYLYVFVHVTGQKGYLGNIWNAGIGDLLFTDWDPNKKADGTIDHTMVVSGYSGQPYISQQTPNRNNIPLSLSISLAASQGRTVVWYGLIT